MSTTPRNNRFWKINNYTATGTASIFIYEQIGYDWWTGEGIEAKQLCQEIAALNVTGIDVFIKSAGGSFFDGLAIYHALKRHPAQITTYNDGLAASSASVIFCAGDRRVTNPGSVFMIHLPTTDALNANANDMRKAAEALDTVRDSLVAIYRTVSTLSEEDLVSAVEAETYYSADQTLAFGFATELGTEVKIAACAKKTDFRALGYRDPKNAVVQLTVWEDEELPEGGEETAEEQGCYCTGCNPETPCGDCAAADTCINPKKETTKPGMEMSGKNKQPQGAKQEVVVMTQAAAPASGARDFQKEAVEIIAMCNQSHCPEKAADFITSGLTPDAAGKQILDMISAGQIKAFVPAAEAKPIVDLGKDARNYSYARAIGLMHNSIANKAKPAGLEYEVHQDLVKNAGHSYSEREGSILIPHRVSNGGNSPAAGVMAQVNNLLRAGNTAGALQVLNTALTTTGTNTGKETVFQEYGEFIDILRNMMVTSRMGARVLTGLKGPINFPKQTGANTLYWTGENSGSDVTGGNITFSTVQLTPKTCQAQTAMSRQLIIESTPDVEGIVRNDLAMVHALGWDFAALHGSGSNNQPTGLYNLSGVNAVAMGGVPDYTKLVDMITKVATFNALLGNTGWVTNPLMAGKLMTTLDFPSTAAGKAIWQGKHSEGVVAGYDAIASNQVLANMGAGTNEVGMLFGNWDDLLIGMWGALELLVDPYTLAGQGLIKVTSFQMIDIAARRAQSFSKSTGATIS